MWPRLHPWVQICILIVIRVGFLAGRRSEVAAIEYSNYSWPDAPHAAVHCSALQCTAVSCKLRFHTGTLCTAALQQIHASTVEQIHVVQSFHNALHDAVEAQWILSHFCASYIFYCSSVANCREIQLLCIEIHRSTFISDNLVLPWEISSEEQSPGKLPMSILTAECLAQDCMQ